MAPNCSPLGGAVPAVSSTCPAQQMGDQISKGHFSWPRREPGSWPPGLSGRRNRGQIQVP